MHYNYTFLFHFEKGVDHEYARWITEEMEKFYPKSFLICGAYMACIYYGQKMMKNRPAFDLRQPLIFWNIFLSVFSIFGTVRFLPDFTETLRQDGFVHSICIADYTWSVPGWWTIMFAASKILELGDTFFLVARKRPVIFLHWYHHVSVLLYTWHGFKEMNAAGRWFIAMNFTVHAIMYPYYTARALGYRTPKWLSMSITTMQISQMFMGCFIMCVISYFRFLVPGQPCKMTNRNLALGSLMYATYLALFANFFYQTYLKRKHRSVASSTATAATSKKNLSNGTVYANGHVRQANGAVANGHVKHD